MKHTIDTPKYLQETSTFTSNNIVEVGTAVTIDSNGLASGYTTSSYLKYNTGVAFNPSDGSDFEVNIAFKLPTGATGGILIGTDNNRFHFDAQYGNFYYYAGIRPTITRNSLTVELFDETKNAVLSYSRCEKFYTASISYTFDTTTTYVVNIKKSGTSYTTTLTDINNSFTQTYTDTSNKIVNQYNRLIGANLYTEGGTSTAFDGEIDLFNSWIKKNGNLWWTNKDVVHAGLVPQPHSVNTPKYLKKVVVEEAFVQPILTANGTMGGNAFAVDQSSVYISANSAWRAFDNDATGAAVDNSQWLSNGNPSVSSPQWLTFYNPVKIKVTNLKIQNRNDGFASVTQGKIQGSDDNSNWIDIKSFTNSMTSSGSWNIDLSNNTNAYNYYRILVTGATSNQCLICQITVTATQEVTTYTTGTSSNYDTIIPQRHTVNVPKYLKKVTVETAWTQPVLTSNTSNNCIVTSSAAYNSYPAYYVMDGVTTDSWFPNTITGWWQIVFPEKILITGLTHVGGGYNQSSYSISGRYYADSSKTIPIGDAISGTYSQGQQVQISNIPNEGIYTDTIYFDKTGGSANAGIGELYITATKYSEQWQAGTENDYTIII